MHWYGGSIAEAVNLSKQKNAIFVVFVEGETEQSGQMAVMLEDATVLKRLSDQDNFLAIKLKSGSIDYTNFAQIYQLVPVPSLFFIGRNGVPLEVVCEGVQPNYLADRIDRILEQHHKDGNSTVQASSSSKSLKEQTASLLQAETSAGSKHYASDQQPESSSSQPKVAKTEHHEVTKSGVEYTVVCDGDVCTRQPRSSQDPGPSTRPEPVQTPSAPVEESAADIASKMERAKELIEARRREKAEKEKEAERLKELERREAGQGVAELKRWQADQELKQIQEERKREKLENTLARQRILEQIAQDRAERRARDAPQADPLETPTTPAATTPTSGDASCRARIQFKFWDGESQTAHFDAEDTIADIRRYVANILQVENFTLWTAFPRRELTDQTATLRSMQLAPSAALFVIQAAAPVSQAGQYYTTLVSLGQLFTAIFVVPPTQLYYWIRSFLFPGWTPPASGGSRPLNSGPAAPQAPSPPPGVRRRGNIHRLPGETGDEDNNTWNGNSTQQM